METDTPNTLSLNNNKIYKKHIKSSDRSEVFSTKLPNF